MNNRGQFNRVSREARLLPIDQDAVEAWIQAVCDARPADLEPFLPASMSSQASTTSLVTSGSPRTSASPALPPTTATAAETAPVAAANPDPGVFGAAPTGGVHLSTFTGAHGFGGIGGLSGPRKQAAQASQRAQRSQSALLAASGSPQTSSPLSRSSPPANQPASNTSSARPEPVVKRNKADLLTLKNTFVSQQCWHTAHSAQVAVLPSKFWIAPISRYLGSHTRVDLLHQACDEAGLTVVPSIYSSFTPQEVFDHLSPGARRVIDQAVIDGTHGSCCQYGFRLVDHFANFLTYSNPIAVGIATPLISRPSTGVVAWRKRLALPSA